MVTRGVQYFNSLAFAFLGLNPKRTSFEPRLEMGDKCGYLFPIKVHSRTAPFTGFLVNGFMVASEPYRRRAGLFINREATLLQAARLTVAINEIN